MKSVLFFVLFITVVPLMYILLERFNSGKHLSVKISLSTGEVYEGDTLCYTEVIENRSILPIRSVRIDTILPEGLVFVIPGMTDSSTVSELMFVGPYRHIERVWKIRAVQRGIYTADKVRVIAASLIGSEMYSDAAFSAVRNTLTVLPSSISVEEHFRYSGINCDEETNAGFLTDPIIKDDIREYNTNDPFRSINWKLTASHGRLMVNTEPFESRELNILLNIQSRPFEQHELTPSSRSYTELAVTTAASLLNAVTDSDMPVTIITNAVCQCAGDETVHLNNERYFTITDQCSSRSGILTYLELLASVENSLTCTARDMFRTLADMLCSGNYSINNLVVVSPYFDASMAEFHRIVSELRIPVVYYLVCGRNDADVIPDDARIYYYTYK